MQSGGTGIHPEASYFPPTPCFLHVLEGALSGLLVANRLGPRDKDLPPSPGIPECGYTAEPLISCHGGSKPGDPGFHESAFRDYNVYILSLGTVNVHHVEAVTSKLRRCHSPRPSK